MSKCKITGKVLVIQLGREDTQIVLMGKGATIMHSISVPTPAGAVEDGMIRNADAVRNMLKTAIKEEPAFKRVHQAVFTLCTSQVISETVITPNLPDAKLEKLLQANVDMYFPVDMHDYQLVWQRIGPVVKENGLKELAVQLWAVPTAMLTRYYNVGNACGLSVLAVDYCGHSIATAVGASFSSKVKEQKKSGLNMEISIGRKKTEEAAEEASPVATEVRDNADTDLYLSMEKDLIGMTFVQNATVVFQRFIRCGADPSYQLSELAMMVDYFGSMDVGRGSTVTVIPCGALCNNRMLMGEVEDALGMILSVYPADHDPRFVLCMGAVRTTLDFGVPALNKPGKVRKDFQASLWQYLLILVGGLALVAVIMLLLSSRIVWQSGIGSLKATQQTLTIQAQKTAGFADNYKSYAAKYDSYSADWDTVFASLRTHNDNLVLVLEELEELMPKSSSITENTDRNAGSGVSIWDPRAPGERITIPITGLQIAADGLNVQFACENKEEAAYLIMELREMKYADLVGITNLQGGGTGPATSYGSEAAPTEGSSTGSNNAITNLVKSEITKDELTALAGSLSSKEIKAMEGAYAAQPITIHADLAAYKTAKNPTLEQRKAALTSLLTKQPFAAHRFAEGLLMGEDFDRGKDGILLPLIREELFAMSSPTPAAVLPLITRDEETVTATETLICTDTSVTNVEGWYVYYLENPNDTGYAFLDMEKLAADLMDDGHFNTESTTLNTKLDGLISPATRDLLVKLNDEEEIGKMVSDYFTKGSSDNVTVDALINDYLANGTTGVPAVDEKINAYLQSGALDDEIGAMVDKYLKEGTTHNTIIDGKIDAYLTTGTTGNEQLNAIIDEYMASDTMSKLLKDLFTDYMTDGKTDYPKADELINKYISTGTTNNPTLDAKLDGYLNSSTVKEMLSLAYTLGIDTGNPLLDNQIKQYKKDGTCSNPKLKAMLDEIAKQDEPEDPTGPSEPPVPVVVTTGHDVLDELIRRYNAGPDKTSGHKAIDNIFKSYAAVLIEFGTEVDKTEPTDPKIPGQNIKLTDKEIEDLFKAYLADGTTGNDAHNTIIENYLKHGNTGDRKVNEKLDSLITTDDAKNRIKELAEAYFADGEPALPVMTAAFDNYFLTYNDTHNNRVLRGILDAQLAAGTFDSAIKERLNEYVAGKDDEEPDSPIDPDIDIEFSDEKLEEYLLAYIEKGETGNKTVDKLIESYLTKGTTNVPSIDKQIDAYLASGKANAKVKNAYDLYTMLGILPTENKTIEKLFSSYYNNGRTGNTKIDTWFKAMGFAVKPKAPSANAGTGTGAASSPQDTRVFFNAVLGYNEELKNAELIRKGLYYGDKIEKVEVAE